MRYGSDLTNTVRPEPACRRGRLVEGQTRMGDRSCFDRLSTSGLLNRATTLLHKANVHRPRWMVEQLLAHRLQCVPIDLYVENLPISENQESGLFSDVAALANGVPLQYVMQSASFYGREFRVGPGVLIPRPETEILVEVALDAARSPLIVDVGTGSGVIAITLALEAPASCVIGIDSSQNALFCARQNAVLHHAPVQFFHGNCAEALAPSSVDIMVANLPYLDPANISAWPRELFWEPWSALSGGHQGLSLIRQLMDQSLSVLKPGGLLILEIGMEQTALIQEYAGSISLQLERVVQDLAGMDRVVILRRAC